jgi:serine/threonine-protein kinase OSR1/STK39
MLQDEPPSIDRTGGVNKYSKTFKGVVDRCLTKDPALRYDCNTASLVKLTLSTVQRRPAAELLRTCFFKSAKRKGYLINALLGRLFESG